MGFLIFNLTRDFFRERVFFFLISAGFVLDFDVECGEAYKHWVILQRQKEKTCCI